MQKSTRNYLMVVSLISEDGSMDRNDLTDYAVIQRRRRSSARVPGVGEIASLGVTSTPCASG